MGIKSAHDAEAICLEEIGLVNARGQVAQKIAGSWKKFSSSKIPARGELAQLPLDRVRFWVVDVETTGGRADTGRMIEVAAVEVNNLRPGLKFSSLIKPDTPLPAFITRMTGITDRMLAEAPSAQSVMPLFFSLIRGGVFVAHPASFDWKFIAKESAQEFEMPRVCSLRLARRIHRDLKDHKLDTLAAHHRMRFDNDGSAKARHRALGDAAVTARIFTRFLKQLDERGIKSFLDLKKFENLPLKKAWEIIKA